MTIDLKQLSEALESAKCNGGNGIDSFDANILWHAASLYLAQQKAPVQDVCDCVSGNWPNERMQRDMRKTVNCPKCGPRLKALTQRAAAPVIDDREPAGMRDPKPGTFLFKIKEFWQKSAGAEKDFFAILYDHLNALYVEKRVYQMDAKPAAPPSEVTLDALAELFIEHMQPDRIQGFYYKPYHVIRDVYKEPGEQEIFRMHEDESDARNIYDKRCEVERIKVGLSGVVEAIQQNRANQAGDV